MRDGLEGHCPVMRRPAEHRLGQRRKRDFLGEKVTVCGQLRRLREMGLQIVVCGQVATVEREQEVAEPGVRGGGEAVEDRVQQQFSEVVYRTRYQRRDTQIVSAGLRVFGGESVEVDAGEVEQGVFVVSAIVLVGLVVGGVGAVEGSVDFGLDVVKGVEDRFRRVEVFACRGVIGKAELDF